jgi:hypothetical protein
VDLLGGRDIGGKVSKVCFNFSTREGWAAVNRVRVACGVWWVNRVLHRVFRLLLPVGGGA